MNTEQIPLPLAAHEQPSLDNFISNTNGKSAIAALQQFCHHYNEPFIYLWGPSHSGKSHLLQACCRQLQSQGLQVFYLDARTTLSASIVSDLEQVELVCIDNLARLMGNPTWEEALFHLFNKRYDSKSRLLITAPCPPKQLACQLPDLQSRLCWGLTFQLTMLNDECKLTALQQRAKARGLALSQEAGQFLLNHAPRELSRLFALLDQLDHASLAEQRPLTIPFIKSHLNLI